MTVDAGRPSDRAARSRHPVAVSIAGTVVLTAVLVALWLALPLSGNLDHAAGHLALAIPALVLLASAVTSWPTPMVRAERISRAVLVTGLAVVGCASAAEAIGAFGYAGYERINDLAVLHDLAVLLSPVGLVLLLAGAILSIGVSIASRRGRGTSRYVTGAAILAVVAIVLFVAGGMIFGY